MNKILITIIIFCGLVTVSFNLSDGEPEKISYSSLPVDSREIDANNIRTWFKNDGSFNRRPITGNPGFEWPKDSMKYARYVSGIWLGAKVENETLITHAYYDTQYLPGYIDNNGNPQGRDDPLYRIYRIERGDTLSSDYLNWPFNQGAYANSLGRPFFLGTQTMFYSFTDGYPDAHTGRPGNTNPLKAQVLQTNWSYSNVNIRDVVFTEFRIINRSNVTWNNAYFGFWTDDDVGSAIDDGTGVDTNRNLTYTYNFDNFDPQYGVAPPCVGTLLLRSPQRNTGSINDTIKYFHPPGSANLRIKVGYKHTGLTVFNVSGNKSEEPRNYIEAYYFFEGKQKTGLPWINPITGQITVKLYSGDPVTGTGWINTSEDERRTITSFGNITVQPNDTQSIIVAQLIARGSNNRNSITKLKELSDYVQSVYENNFQEVLAVNNLSNEIPDGFKLNQNYPNPFNPNTVISYQLAASSFVVLKVYDPLGKEVATLVNEKQNAGSYKYQFSPPRRIYYQLPSGIYFYKLVAGNFTETKRMILLK